MLSSQQFPAAENTENKISSHQSSSQQQTLPSKFDSSQFPPEHQETFKKILVASQVVLSPQTSPRTQPESKQQIARPWSTPLPLSTTSKIVQQQQNRIGIAHQEALLRKAINATRLYAATEESKKTKNIQTKVI